MGIKVFKLKLFGNEGMEWSEQHLFKIMPSDIGYRLMGVFAGKYKF